MKLISNCQGGLIITPGRGLTVKEVIATCQGGSIIRPRGRFTII